MCLGGARAANRAQSWRIDDTLTYIGFIDAVGFPTTYGHFSHYKGQILIDFDRPAAPRPTPPPARLSSACRKATGRAIDKLILELPGVSYNSAASNPNFHI